MAGLAPPDIEDSEWQEGMGASNQEVFSDKAMADRIEALVEQMKESPRHLPETFWNELAMKDFRVVGDLDMANLIKNGWREGLRPGAGGWIDDVLALRRPWGFDLADIKVPTAIIQGKADPFTPPQHAELLAERIPNSQLVVAERKSHFNTLEEFMAAVSWLVKQEVEYNPEFWLED